MRRGDVALGIIVIILLNELKDQNLKKKIHDLKISFESVLGLGHPASSVKGLHFAFWSKMLFGPMGLFWAHGIFPFAAVFGVAAGKNRHTATMLVQGPVVMIQPWLEASQVGSSSRWELLYSGRS